MKEKAGSRPLVLWALILLQFLLGLGALAGGGVLILGPDGHLIQMPVSMLKGTPFRDFLVPGILLFVLVGIYPILAGYSLLARPDWRWPDRINPFHRAHWSWAGSLAAGVVLMVWIAAQVILLRAVAFLHVLYFAWGIAMILLTLSPGVRRHLARRS
ncbi:MAG: hypothetical protein ABSB61_10695 [Anaerolineales bacterium]